MEQLLTHRGENDLCIKHEWFYQCITEALGHLKRNHAKYWLNEQGTASDSLKRNLLSLLLNTWRLTFVHRIPKASEFHFKEMWKKIPEADETDGTLSKTIIGLERLFNRKFAVCYFFLSANTFFLLLIYWKKAVNDFSSKRCRMPSTLLCILKSKEPLILEQKKKQNLEPSPSVHLTILITLRWIPAERKRNFPNDSEQQFGKPWKKFLLKIYVV